MKMKNASTCFLFPVKASRRASLPMLFLAGSAAFGPLAFAPAARATGVNVTATSGGSDISADFAENGTSPAFTKLGNIGIVESATSDFAIGTDVTLNLSAPSGWRFSPGVGSVKFARGRDLHSARISVSASTITVTLRVDGTSKIDTVTIVGIKVQAIDGAAMPSAGDILRTSANPGTAIIDGIINDTTSFAALSQAAGAAKALLIHTQPSFTAAVGIPFAQQPVIEIVDQFGNRLSAANGNADDSTVVTATHDGRMLQGATSVMASDGLATFTDLKYMNGETITVDFTATGLVGTTSGSIAVSGAPFMGLQLLVPGETAAPGTPTGKTGTPMAQTANDPFTITVNAVDANWNVVNTSANLVCLTSTDGTAMLPPDAPLVAGTNSFSFTFGTDGSYAITALDANSAAVASDTSPAITVKPSPVTAATGGDAILADTAGGTYTALTGPVYAESKRGSVGSGTIILNAPDGFIFDTSCCPLPTIRINGDPRNSAKNINNTFDGSYFPLTVTSTQATFTVTSKSSTANTLTWQNLRVRPIADSPLAEGMITKSGTSAMAGVTDNSTTFGLLREVEGSLP
jgi:hypothetical protein